MVWMVWVSPGGPGRGPCLTSLDSLGDRAEGSSYPNYLNPVSLDSLWGRTDGPNYANYLDYLN